MVSLLYLYGESSYITNLGDTKILLRNQKWSESHSIMSDSLWPHGLYRPHGVLQARILEWVAFPFSRYLPNPGIEPRSPTLQADSLPAEPQGKPIGIRGVSYLWLTEGLCLESSVSSRTWAREQSLSKWTDGQFRTLVLGGRWYTNHKPEGRGTDH